MFGGSQGAHAINLAMIAALPLLTDLSGPPGDLPPDRGGRLPEVQAAYEGCGIPAVITPFITDMAAEYHRADLIICRAGATTIAEVTACGKPCLFIPFPHAVDDHQRRNAEALLKKQACLMLLERELTGERLAGTIRKALDDRGALQKMGAAAFSLARLDAAHIIVDEMITAMKEGPHVR